MATTQEIQPPALGEQGEPCAGCGSPLAADQRYCLECGARRGAPRVPFLEHLGSANGPAGDPAPPRVARGDQEVSPLGAVIGIAVLGLMLLVGVLIGRGGGEDAAAPSIVTVGAGSGLASGSSETVSTAGELKSDWPEGKDGWTVELGSLPKDGTTAEDLAAAKADVEGRGASDVGALDSDLFASLPGGSWVVYSGVHDSEGEAKKALSEIEADFPDAQVIEVSGEKAAAGGGASEGGGALLSGENAGSEGIVEASEGDIAALDQATGQDYQDALKKLPDQIETPGKPPPIDTSKPPGAGGDAEVIE